MLSLALLIHPDPSLKAFTTWILASVTHTQCKQEYNNIIDGHLHRLMHFRLNRRGVVPAAVIIVDFERTPTKGFSSLRNYSPVSINLLQDVTFYTRHLVHPPIQGTACRRGRAQSLQFLNNGRINPAFPVHILVPGIYFIVSNLYCCWAGVEQGFMSFTRHLIGKSRIRFFNGLYSMRLI